jgi:CelD/BcsL family acetyltransferase involved in cellulose biosynthesis
VSDSLLSSDALAGAGGDSLAIARTPEEARALLEATDGVVWAHPDAELEYYLTVVDALPGVVGPRVIRLDRGDQPPIVVVARLEEGQFDIKLGYLTVARPRLRCLTVVHGGVAGVESPADAAWVLDELRRALAADRADAIRFLGLNAESALYAAATAVQPRVSRDRFAVAQPHWRVAVPESMNAFLAARSGNTRQNLKRYGKRFEKEYAGRLAIRRFGGDGDRDLERLITDLETIAAKTYQRGLGVGFTGDALQRRLMELDMQRGRFLAWVLDIDGSPVAFWDGTAHAGTFYIGSPGYDPALAASRVGTWLQMRMMEDLCARPDVVALDYGMGDAQYKRSFGDECRMDAIVHVFAPTPAGLRVSALRTTALGGTRAAQRLLARTGLEEKLKRVWRSRLRAGGAS